MGSHAEVSPANPAIVQLNSTNWDHWSETIISHMEMRGCYMAIQNELKPQMVSNETWNKAVVTAKCWIKTTICPEYLQIFKGIDCPRQIFNQLKEMHEGTGMDRSLKLVAKLHELKNNFPGLKSVVAKAQILKSEFAQNFDLTEDNFWVAYALDSLPHEYEHLRITLKAQHNLTLKQLNTFLFTEAIRIGQNESTIAQLRTKTNNFSKEDFCLICGRQNHTTEMCFQRQRQSKPNSQSSQSTQSNKSGRKHNGKQRRKGKQKKNNDDLPEENNEKPNHVATILVHQKQEQINSIQNNTRWFLDSGATNHVVNHSAQLSNIRSRSDLSLSSASGDEIIVAGTADALLEFDDLTLTLKDVILSPNVTSNFLSVNRLLKFGFQVNFTVVGGRSCAVVTEKKKTIFKAFEENGMFRIITNNEKLNQICQSKTNNKTVESYLSWHRKLGHLNFNSLQKLKDDLGLPPLKEDIKCDSCDLAKSIRLPFKSSSIKSTGPLDLIHTDTSGTIRIPNLNKFNSFITFTDDFSRHSFVYMLNDKSQVLDVFKKFKSLVENQLNRKIKSIRSDNGTEYTNLAFRQFCQQAGIAQQFTQIHTPQQNGVSERLNRSIKQGTTALLIQSRLPISIWPQAVMFYIHMKNISPSAAVNFEIPHELFFKRKAEYKQLRVFGCKCVYRKPSTNHKFDSTGEFGYFVGFPSDKSGYLIYNSTNNSIVNSRDVKFFENEFYCAKQQSSSTSNNDSLVQISEFLSDSEIIPFQNSESDVQNLNIETQSDLIPLNSPNQHEDTSTNEDDQLSSPPHISPLVSPSSNQQIVTQPPIRRTRPRKTYVPSKEYELRPRNHLCYIHPNREIDKLLSGPNAQKWNDAMREEFDSLMQNNTWTLVKRPADAKVIESMWILKEKFEGSQTRFKARFVAKGFRQKYGVDYFETFSPVVNQSSVRLLLSHAIQNRMEVFHLDVKTAYLNSKLEETIYIAQPYLFEKGNDMVCKLNKAIYGLKQAAKCWNQHLTSVLLEMDFEQLNADHCIFANACRTSIIAIYVDDLLIITKNQTQFDMIQKRLNSHFQITNKGKASHFLGVEIRQLKDTIELSQVKFIDDLLTRFKMEQCRGVATPMTPETSIEATEQDQPCEDLHLFQSIVGSLIYLSNGTRPDIQFATNQLCKFMSNAREKHLTMAKRILRYLQRTKQNCLQFIFNPSFPKISIFSDSDFSNDKVNSKSITGLIVLHHGNLIRWASNTQDSVALSTCEAEINSVKEATADAIYFRKLIGEIERREMNTPTDLFNDNQSAIRTLESGGKWARNRHYLTKINFIRDQLRKGTIRISFVESNSMLADPLTKPLTESKLQFLFQHCGLIFD